MEYLGLLFVFGSILFLAYVTTKYIGKKNVRALKGRYMNIIESLSIGMDKQLHLVKIADQFVLIATSGKNIEFLTNVNIEEYEPEEASENESGTSADFKTILEKYLPNINVSMKKGDKFKNGLKDKDSFGQSVTFSTNLRKLKNITSTVEEVKDRDGEFDG